MITTNHSSMKTVKGKFYACAIVEQRGANGKGFARGRFHDRAAKRTAQGGTGRSGGSFDPRASEEGRSPEPVAGGAALHADGGDEERIAVN
jgi:hypothetical protein